MIGVTLVMLVLLLAFFRFTRVGLAMRAAAANPESARLVGIRVSMMTALGWGMAAAIGAVAGMLIAPVVFLEPNMMLSILLYGFAGAVLGGLTSPLGAVLGGFAVGIIENLAGTYIPVVGAELKLTIALFLIVAGAGLQARGPDGPPRRAEGLIWRASTRPGLRPSGRRAASRPHAGADACAAGDRSRRCRQGDRHASLVIAALAALPWLVGELLHLPDDPAAGLRHRDPRA